jgi:hypothetical protein
MRALCRTSLLLSANAAISELRKMTQVMERGNKIRLKHNDVLNKPASFDMAFQNKEFHRSANIFPYDLESKSILTKTSISSVHRGREIHSSEN